MPTQPTRVTTKRVLKSTERQKELLEHFKRPLPKGWRKMSEATLLQWDTWMRRKAQGWIEEEELIERLHGFEWNGRLGPFDYVAFDNFPDLYPPLTFEGFIAHPRFKELIVLFLDTEWEFFAYCLGNADLRCILAAAAFTG